MSYKANKCSDAGTEDLGVLTAHETSPWFSLVDVGSSANKIMLIASANRKCSDKRWSVVLQKY